MLPSVSQPSSAGLDRVLVHRTVAFDAVPLGDRHADVFRREADLTRLRGLRQRTLGDQREGVRTDLFRVGLVEHREVFAGDDRLRRDEAQTAFAVLHVDGVGGAEVVSCAGGAGMSARDGGQAHGDGNRRPRRTSHGKVAASTCSPFGALSPQRTWTNGRSKPIWPLASLQARPRAATGRAMPSGNMPPVPDGKPSDGQREDLAEVLARRALTQDAARDDAVERRHASRRSHRPREHRRPRRPRLLRRVRPLRDRRPARAARGRRADRATPPPTAWWPAPRASTATSSASAAPAPCSPTTTPSSPAPRAPSATARRTASSS